ncbi:MAG: HAMP domain-containing sensor histidine kinase [Methanoregula sp.]|nr:HAMP domain-containing sensor histidine kinase [Methanoregula sp.]
MFQFVKIDPDGRVVEYQSVGSDITDRKLVEEALALASKKLTLLSSITRHDINNQLTLLMGYLTLIEKKQLDPTFNNYFGKVNSAAKRISAMIQFTKEYESIGINAPAWQDCRTVVDTAAREAQLGKIGKVVMKNDLPAGGEIFADPLVVKVFYNLMDNAARYGGKITTIRFSLEEREGDHLIICEDDGDGVIAEEKEKIFERGFGKNTGLGLALSREILAITGITITENGEPVKGARFAIRDDGAKRGVADERSGCMSDVYNQPDHLLSGHQIHNLYRHQPAIATNRVQNVSGNVNSTDIRVLFIPHESARMEIYHRKIIEKYYLIWRG